MSESKYHARARTYQGQHFASGLELRRWLMLQEDERRGVIQGLRRQVRYPLCVNGTKLGDYVADAVYTRDGVTVIEDAKGKLLPFCAWKLKHMAAQGNLVTLWPEPKPKARKARVRRAMP